MQQQQPAPIGAPSNVLHSLAQARDRRDLKSTAEIPQVGPAEGQVSTFPKAGASAKKVFSADEAAAAYEQLPRAERQMISTLVDDALAKRGIGLSETGRNEKMRRDRSDVWRAAEAKLDYWKAWQKLNFAIQHAHSCEVLDDLGLSKAMLRPHGDFSEPWVLDNELRHHIHAAEIALLLTPAPTVAALKFKKAKLSHPWYQHEVDVDTAYIRKHLRLQQSPFRDIEQSIADDENWLAAHPARQCRSNSARRSTDGV